MSRQRTCEFPAWTITRHMTLNIPKVCLTFLFRDILRDPGNLMRNMIGSGFLELKPSLARQRAEIKMRKMSLFTQLQNGTQSFSPRGALLILPPRGSQSKGTKTPPPFTLQWKPGTSVCFEPPSQKYYEGISDNAQGRVEASTPQFCSCSFLAMWANSLSQDV